jgi:predicted  nucleic acid-binding Zn-ribbon protein
MITPEIVEVLKTAGIACLTWILSRTKSKTEIAKMKEETAAVYLANVEDAVALWKGIAKDLEQQVINLTTEVKMLRKENAELRTAYEKLEKLIQEKV